MLSGVHVITDAHTSYGSVLFTDDLRFCIDVHEERRKVWRGPFKSLSNCCNRDADLLLTYVVFVFEVSKFDTIFTHDTFI